MRQIVLDTETTGLEADLGHRIIEIGAVEVVNRKLTGNHFHKYLNPQRDIDDGAFEVHGLSRTFLQDKPLFADIADEFIAFIRDAELVIHNAPFDVSFMDYEFRQLGGSPRTADICTIKDSLAIARNKHPGQKNNLDALCRRYLVDNSQRQLHGALLDAEILADVYLLMTGGQTLLFGSAEQTPGSVDAGPGQVPVPVQQTGLRVVRATLQEAKAHEQFLDLLTDKSDTEPLWRSQARDKSRSE